VKRSADKNGRILTGKQQEAAALLAEDCFTDEKIAEAVGVTRSTLAEWKKIAEFASLVSEVSSTYGQRAIKHGIARKERRLRVLNDIHDGILRVYAERGTSPDLAYIPGGKTGLVTKQRKGIGKGDDFQVVESYEIDTGSIRELRGIQEQVAEELGQRVERRRVEFEDITKVFEARSEEELEFFTQHGHWPGEECKCTVQ
jgi:hypothetical protein